MMQQRKPDIGFIPTPLAAIDAMLALANVTDHDILYDLGCGDGRILIRAAQQSGIRGVGIDIDPQRVREAEDQAQQAGVGDRLEFCCADLFDSDVSAASVVILYLLPHLNLRLRPRLLHQLKPGSRIVSHDFDMGNWVADRLVKMHLEDELTLYYWVVPETLPECLRGE
ncbi:MAG: SAM-dependent methyltransferase [Elainellaceae cyanobacterium]